MQTPFALNGPQRLLTTLLTVVMLWTAGAADAARLKDLASIKGVRSNQIIGYGLVVGLNGTGDGNNAGFTTQSLANLMANMGIQVNGKELKVKNVAAVMITAQLPPFAKTGQTIDVTVSSLGDCSSLQGGTLVATPLKGLDGNIYAMAQGAISSGSDPGQQAQGLQKKHLTVARIPNGASVEREVQLSFAGKETISISLDTPDFTTVSRMAKAVNGFLGKNYAKPADGATLQVTVPEKYRDNPVGLLAALETLEITPDAAAKVILDERNGTVVMGENITISRLALSHGNLSLRITPEPDAPMAGGAGDRLVTLKEGATLGEVVRALNAIGATPRDLSAIFQSMKASGALQAELEII